MSKMNETVGEKNHFDKSGGRKWLVRHFTKNEFWKCIACILSAVKYGMKGQKYLGGISNIYQ